MFYPVRIFAPDHRLKKIISSKELSKIHWKNFQMPTITLSDERRGYKFPQKNKKSLSGMAPRSGKNNKFQVNMN
ncbi:MAG: hypothetical protein ACQ9MH_11840 [Nitrospinales bacterium]